jgi:hypothetical protein
MMRLDEYFKDGKAHVWAGTFAVLKSNRVYPGAFANIQDKNEITVIIEESQYRSEDALEVEPGWKIITFDMVLPFGLVGFLARISGELAETGISIFAVSAYSTDHVLVKEKDLLKAISRLRGLGLTIEEN